MPRRGFLFAAFLVFAGIGAGYAQEGARLSFERLGELQTGTYSTSTGVSFSLDRYGDKYLMRVAGEPEIYVLYVDGGTLGGRVLKYDSGATAIQVSGWGALTIYTDAQPSGLPAERTAGSTAPAVQPVSLSEMQGAAEDESEHLAYVRGLHIAFDADWSALSGDPELRALAFDAMQNAARGIDRFTANPAARQKMAARVGVIHLATGGKPTIDLVGKVLTVTFVPAHGFAGRASSHGIARALGQMFSIPTAG
ncbi:MAG: DUF4908 domain-containing protein [Proteobacteria bacterium]|nr:DUF4908 domain-containing protein [Pseudomonadota bacterium]